MQIQLTFSNRSTREKSLQRHPWHSWGCWQLLWLQVNWSCVWHQVDTGDY